jgi:serine/threonine protein kinase
LKNLEVKMTSYRRNPSVVINIQRQRERKREYIKKFNFPCCKEWTNYEIVAKIGSGTYAEVLKARNKKAPNRFVAMKKILLLHESETFPITALREIQILQHLKQEKWQTVGKRVRAGGEGRTPASVVMPYHYALTSITTQADTGLVTQGWVGDKPCLVTVDTGAYVTVARPDIAARWPEKQLNPGLALQTVSGEALPIMK